MGKLRMNLDQLTVESFDTSAPAGRRGTVFGEEQCTCPTACETACTCPGCNTCDHTACNQESCNGTCGTTCGYGSGCYTCGATEGAYTCDYSATGGGVGMCQCCPL
jgi:hypothetical protein